MFISFSDFILNESKISNDNFKSTIKNYFFDFNKKLIEEFNRHYNLNIELNNSAFIMTGSPHHMFVEPYDNIHDALDNLDLDREIAIENIYMTSNNYKIIILNEIDSSYINFRFDFINLSEDHNKRINLIDEKYTLTSITNIDSFYNKIWRIISHEKFL
jgi:hypothetical protein